MKSKWFKGNGDFTLDGLDNLSNFKFELGMISSCDDVKEMSESELKLLGANLSKMIGDFISNIIHSK